MRTAEGIAFANPWDKHTQLTFEVPLERPTMTNDKHVVNFIPGRWRRRGLDKGQVNPAVNLGQGRRCGGKHTIHAVGDGAKEGKRGGNDTGRGGRKIGIQLAPRPVSNACQSSHVRCHGYLRFSTKEGFGAIPRGKHESENPTTPNVRSASFHVCKGTILSSQSHQLACPTVRGKSQ